MNRPKLGRPFGTFKEKTLVSKTYRWDMDELKTADKMSKRLYGKENRNRYLRDALKEKNKKELRKAKKDG